MRERAAAVVVNYNDSETTLAQIRRIRDYAALDRIIVVDNASTDRSLAALRAVAGGKVTVLAAKRNGGYGAGNNLGIRYAAKKGIQYALIANPDAEFTASCLAALVAAMRANPAIAVLSPVQVNPSHGKAAEQPGSRANVLSGAAAFPLRSWLPDLLEAGPVARRLFTPLLHYPESHYREKLAPVDCVPGSLLLVDIERFLAAGGYDERVFLYEEEYILGQRLRRIGAETALLTTERYLHRHAASIGKSYRRALDRQRLRERAMRFYFRHYLGCGRAKLLFTELYFALIRLEIFLTGGGK